MDKMQDLILAEIAAIVKKAGYRIAQQSAWSNTGTVFFLPKDDITPFGQTTYDFQDATYKLTITWRGVKIPSQPGRSDYFDFYQKYGESTRYFAALAELLLHEKGRQAPAQARLTAP